MDSLHWQYASKHSDTALFQGDVLERTPDLEQVLIELYPYAYKHQDKYPFFLVLTQTCDLVNDGGREHKAEHITLCATRPIDYLLDSEISKLQKTAALREAGICPTDRRPALLDKVERLLSNELYPYFYLHPTANTPFTTAHVGYLRISFPLSATLHYDTCLKAKRLELAPEFQAKLGWLTTLVFGRVATKDFGKKERHVRAMEYLNGRVKWISSGQIVQEVQQRKLGQNLNNLTAEQIRELVADLEVKSRPDKLADIIVKHARGTWSCCKEEQFDKFRRALLKDRSLFALIGDDVSSGGSTNQ